MLSKTPEEKHQALEDLLKIAPMNKLPEIMANVAPFMDQIDKSKPIYKAALAHSAEHMAVLPFEDSRVLIAEENCARNTQNGVCIFYDYKLDLITKKETLMSFSVDIFDQKVLKANECEAALSEQVFFEPMYLSRFEFLGHLSTRFPNKDILKHFLFVNDDDIFIVYYTLKLIRPESFM